MFARRPALVAIWVAALLKHVSLNHPLAISLFHFSLTETHDSRGFLFLTFALLFAWHIFSLNLHGIYLRISAACMNSAENSLRLVLPMDLS